MQYNNATISNAFLRGPGTHTTLPGTSNIFSGVTTYASTKFLQGGADTFLDFSNGGPITNNGTLAWDGGMNNTGGSLTVNNTVTADDFANNGIIVINNGGVLNNHLSDLTSGGGGRIYVNSGGTLNADSQGEGVALDLQDSLLLNNGTVAGTTNVYYGATVEGSGSFGQVNLLGGGSMSVASASALQPTSIASGDASGAGVIVGSGTLASPVSIDALQVNVAKATDDLLLSGPLTGGGELTKTGNGMLVLSGDDNTFNGDMIVSQGTLDVENGGALADGFELDCRRRLAVCPLGGAGQSCRQRSAGEPCRRRHNIRAGLGGRARTGHAGAYGRRSGPAGAALSQASQRMRINGKQPAVVAV